MPPYNMEEYKAVALEDDSILPTIDLSAFALGDDYDSRKEERQEIAAKLHIALKATGFFYAVGHGMPDETYDNAFKASMQFFDLPIEKKEELAASNNPLWRGYTAVGVHSCTKDVDKPDLKETYSIGATGGPEGKPKSKLHGPNQWPTEEQCAGFADKVQDYYKYIEKEVAMRILRAIAVSLDLKDDFFTSQCGEDGVCSFALLHYPALDKSEADPSKRQGCGSHTDWGFLSILAQDSPGLQLRLEDGTWVHAPPKPHAFVVNVANILSRWTANMYKSSEHRVWVPSPDTDRISLGFFITPNYNTTIETLPQCTAVTGVKYPPFLLNKYLYDQIGIMYDPEIECGDHTVGEVAERAKRAAEKRAAAAASAAENKESA